MNLKLKLLRRNTLVKNSLYNFTIQFFNYIVPLLLVPYLTRTLGQDGFGKVAFTQSFVMLVNILPEFGFSLSANREIAQNRNNKEVINKIVSNTIYTKIVLLLISLIIISPLFLVIPIFKYNIELFIVSYFLLIAVSINTDWYYLGYETLKKYTYNIVVSKILLISLTFVFLNKSSNPVIYLILLTFTTFLSNIKNLLNMLESVNINMPSKGEIIKSIKSSTDLFVFKITVSLYTSANSFILGLLLKPDQVGIFAAAEKVTKAIAGLWGALNSSIFPRINNLLSIDFHEAKKLIRKTFFAYTLFGFLLTLGLFFGSDIITVLFLGKNFTDSIQLMKILSFVIILIAMSNVIGILWLIPLKKDKQFNFIIITAGILNIVLGVSLTIQWGAKGMAYSILITELFVTTACIYSMYKFKEVSFV